MLFIMVFLTWKMASHLDSTDLLMLIPATVTLRVDYYVVLHRGLPLKITWKVTRYSSAHLLAGAGQNVRITIFKSSALAASLFPGPVLDSRY